MRKLLAVALVAAFAATASASQLGLRFAGPNADDDANATVAQGGSVTVEVLWTQDAAGATVGLNQTFFLLTSAIQNALGNSALGAYIEDADIAVTSRGPGALTSGGQNGTVGGLAALQYAIGNIDAVGTTVVGTFEVTAGGTAALGAHPFYILRNANSASPDATHEPGASAYNLDLSGAASGYDGTYDIGNGFAGKNTGAGALPMTINVTPEPAALALLALGGIAVLRRRS